MLFDDADAAVTACLELLDSLPAEGLPDGHAGIHAGPIVRRDGDVFGRTVNTAARVSDVTPPGEAVPDRGCRGPGQLRAGRARRCR